MNNIDTHLFYYQGGSTNILQRTIPCVSAYLSLLSEDKKKDFAAQPLQFINSQPVSAEDKFIRNMNRLSSCIHTCTQDIYFLCNIITMYED